MPAVEGPVVVDATPIVALAGLGRLDLFHSLYGEVLVPPAVWHELETGGQRPGGRADLGLAPWIKIATPAAAASLALSADLDRGEAEVIALAGERNARLVVIDDRLGRRHALRLGLDVTGTIGVLLRAKELGHVDRILPVLDGLQRNGLYLSERLKSWARERADET